MVFKLTEAVEEVVSENPAVARTARAEILARIEELWAKKRLKSEMFEDWKRYTLRVKE